MLPRRYSVSLAALFCAAATAHAEDNTAAEAAERFLTGARAIVADVQANSADGAAIADAVTAILEDAKPVVEAYGVLHAQCAVQLARVLELYPEIDTWSATQIRRDIEGAAALPQADGCYPARDVVAHPAIVRALARQGLDATVRTRLVREMNEAIEHMEEIATEL